ncbi:hypothetical protein QA584_13705 [Anaerocolumna sp. AGMB13025]|uniref:hypothetical protein n=1 Tax=Anaerocolumna sp. AGMB13025 TaxID=3039116 RepID=UPI00241E38B5|nr:hypothetical protein [Anaerocolumna sp. AGMB13025]WFR60086.1 hypothetical protein QA584_13705 [Anaerocolumna sp. AGMB13025]
MLKKSQLSILWLIPYKITTRLMFPYEVLPNRQPAVRDCITCEAGLMSDHVIYPAY